MGSSWTRDQTQVPCIARWIPLNHWATREALPYLFNDKSHHSCLTRCLQGRVNSWTRQEHPALHSESPSSELPMRLSALLLLWTLPILHFMACTPWSSSGFHPRLSPFHSQPLSATSYPHLWLQCQLPPNSKLISDPYVQGFTVVTIATTVAAFGDISRSTGLNQVQILS